MSLLPLIEQRLKELIPARDETLLEAVRYSLLASGKRLRPLLTLETARCFGVDPHLALDPACAIEMIHTYSLIHDDLPCMDNSDLRRGKPSLHKIYGDAMALLAGDYLLTKAFEVIATASQLGREQRLQMLKTVAQRSGAPGLIGGQAIDISQVGQEIDEDTLFAMHEGKTSALFSACLECGSLAAGYPPSPELLQIGRDLGLAYQLQDDLLDATATTASLGKTAGSDAAHNKPTATSLFGIPAVKEKLHALKESVLSNLAHLPQKGGPLVHLTQVILKIDV